MILERGADVATGSARKDPAGPPASAPPQSMPGTNELLARVGGDAVLLGEMAALFLDECPAHLTGIRQAVARLDARALEIAAHALRGSVSNFGAEPAARAALQLELMGRDGDLTGSEQALHALESELEPVRRVLEELR